MIRLILNSFNNYRKKFKFLVRHSYLIKKMTQEYKTNPCIIPTPKRDDVGDDRWNSIHKRCLAEAKSTEADILFIGDSIIQLLQFSTLWTTKINSLHCLNFGIGGDRVEHVLWRLNNGALDLAKPVQIVVLSVGTNNTDCKAEDVFDGICNIVDIIQDKFLGVSVILPTLLPRGQFPNSNRDRNLKVNEMLKNKYNDTQHTDGKYKNVAVLPIHENILQSDETVSHHIMFDYLHLTDQGYTKVFTPLYECLVATLKKRQTK